MGGSWLPNTSDSAAETTDIAQAIPPATAVTGPPIIEAPPMAHAMPAFDQLRTLAAALGDPMATMFAMDPTKELTSAAALTTPAASALYAPALTLEMMPYAIALEAPVAWMP